MKAPAATNARAVIDRKTLPIGATTAARKSSGVTKPALTVTLPKPITSSVEAKGRFGKQYFVYLSDEDVHSCPAGEKLAYHYTNEENGLVLRAIGPTPVRAAPSNSVAPLARSDRLRAGSTSMCWRQKRLDRNPQAMRRRRETAARDGRGLYSEVRDHFNLLVREGPHAVPRRE
jgi:hypothetical protein